MSGANILAKVYLHLFFMIVIALVLSGFGPHLMLFLCKVRARTCMMVEAVSQTDREIDIQTKMETET